MVKIIFFFFFFFFHYIKTKIYIKKKNMKIIWNKQRNQIIKLFLILTGIVFLDCFLLFILKVI